MKKLKVVTSYTLQFFWAAAVGSYIGGAIVYPVFWLHTKPEETNVVTILGLIGAWASKAPWMIDKDSRESKEKAEGEGDANTP